MAGFAALSQPSRLATVKLLVKRWPEGLAAGAIAEAVGAPSSTMSTHLAILARAGLISARREGRTITYTAELGGITALVGFLLEDCCAGRPEVCAPVSDAIAATASCCPANEHARPQTARRPRRRTRAST